MAPLFQECEQGQSFLCLHPWPFSHKVIIGVVLFLIYFLFFPFPFPPCLSPRSPPSMTPRHPTPDLNFKSQTNQRGVFSFPKTYFPSFLLSHNPPFWPSVFFFLLVLMSIPFGKTLVFSAEKTMRFVPPPPLSWLVPFFTRLPLIRRNMGIAHRSTEPLSSILS